MIEIDKLIRVMVSHECGDRRAVAKQPEKNTLEANLRRLPDPKGLGLFRGGFDPVNGDGLDAELRFGTLFERACSNAWQQTDDDTNPDHRKAAKMKRGWKGHWGYTHDIETV